MNDHDTDSDDGELARSVTRLGDTAAQLAEVLGRVDENQKMLLKLRFDVVTLRDKTEMDTVRLDTANQIAKVRNKTAVLVIVIMIAASVLGLVSYTRVRADANAATTSTAASYAAKSRCQIQFNGQVIAILKERGQLDSRDQSNLTVLLQKLAIPGTTYEQGQIFRRDFIAESMAVQTKRDALVFPKTACTAK